MTTNSIVQVLAPDDRAGEVCNDSACQHGPVALIGEAGEVAVCPAHAARVIQDLLAIPEVLDALMNSPHPGGRWISVPVP